MIRLTETDFAPERDALPVIQDALDAENAVEIGKISFPLLLSAPILLKSGRSLRVDPETLICGMPDCGGCLLRNENIFIGAVSPEPDDAPYDADMSVEGGIWHASGRTWSEIDSERNPAIATLRDRGTILGVLFFCSARRFSVRNITVRQSDFYAVLVSRCQDFLAEGLYFEDQYKDGIHINGPTARGTVRNVRGTCGDDIVALNAWDWHSSAVNYGPISHITVENVEAEHDEMRLLPGKKLYDDGSVRDCPITDCAFRRMSGLYSVKMYQQPYCYNKTRRMNDRSLTGGLLEDILFEDISVEGTVTEALAEVTLDAFWEIGADAKNVVWRRVAVAADEETFRSTGMSLVTVGPKSSTWKRGETDPEKWEELFEPDLICHADGLTLEEVTFAGAAARREDTVLRVVHLSPNPDYPNTTPMGGTGYGVVRNLRIL